MTPKKPISGGPYDLPESIARARTPKNRQSDHQSKMKLLSICSAILFALGTYWLIDPQSVPHWIEVATIGIAGGIATYAINGVAITRGAYQAASGVAGAMAASVGAVLVTGLTISMVSFTGLTINSIDQMVMQQFGRENSLYVDTYVAAVRQSDEIVVAVDAASNQVSASAECERSSSCISRRGSGGEGQTFHVLNGIVTQVDTVLQSLTEGEAARDEALIALEETDAEIQIALNTETGSRKVRRAQVYALLSDQRAALADLERALPISVVTSLADTLKTGVTISNDRDLTQRINANLAPIGVGIMQAIDNLEITDLQRPDLPPETGVMTTLGWVGFFLPLFSMLILIDTLFPLLLWFFAYSALRPLVEPEEGEADNDPFSVSRVLDAPPVQMSPTIGTSKAAPRTKGQTSK